jgi:hypothetical protein
LPDPNLVSEFELLALKITKWGGHYVNGKEKEVVVNFGVSVVVIAKVWEMIQ